jgi:hypothetical protein
MRNRLRTLLILLAFLPPVLVLPASVHAQWATTRVEHDWTLAIGEHRFGLEQTMTLPGSYRTTTVHLGPVSVRSKLHTGSIVALVVIPIAMLLAAVAISVKRTTPRGDT